MYETKSIDATGCHRLMITYSYENGKLYKTRDDNILARYPISVIAASIELGQLIIYRDLAEDDARGHFERRIDSLQAALHTYQQDVEKPNVSSCQLNKH